MKKALAMLAFLPALLYGEEEGAPPLPDYNFVNEFVRMLSILGIMIGVLLLLSWFMKRMMATRMEQMNSSSNIQILERRALGPKSALYLLDVEGQTILVSESPAGIHHLTNLDQKRDEAHEMV